MTIQELYSLFVILVVVGKNQKDVISFSWDHFQMYQIIIVEKLQNDSLIYKNIKTYEW